MYRLTAGACDGLTLKAPKPSCHENRSRFSDSQRDEFALRSRTIDESEFFAGNANKMLNVIGRAAQSKNLHVQILGDPKHICKKPLLLIHRNQIQAFLCAENAVNQISGVGVGHGVVPTGLDSKNLGPQPLRAGLTSAAPSGLQRAGFTEAEVNELSMSCLLRFGERNHRRPQNLINRPKSGMRAPYLPFTRL